MYEIKIKHLFGWKSYHVVAHATEVLGATARLVLEFADGSKLSLPQIEKKTVIIYPEV